MENWYCAGLAGDRGRTGRALAASLALALVTAAHAQIRTDGTLGGLAVTLEGPNFVINEALGRLAGNNLFHSFQVFSVGAAESATFLTLTPALANVISRVTTPFSLHSLWVVTSRSSLRGS